MMIDKVVAFWRKRWEWQRCKHGLGPIDDVAWEEYLDGLKTSEVLRELSWHAELLREESGE